MIYWPWDIFDREEVHFEGASLEKNKIVRGTNPSGRFLERGNASWKCNMILLVKVTERIFTQNKEKLASGWSLTRYDLHQHMFGKNIFISGSLERKSKVFFQRSFWIHRKFRNSGKLHVNFYFHVWMNLNSKIVSELPPFQTAKNYQHIDKTFDMNIKQHETCFGYILRLR